MASLLKKPELVKRPINPQDPRYGANRRYPIRIEADGRGQLLIDQLLEKERETRPNLSQSEFLLEVIRLALAGWKQAREEAEKKDRLIIDPRDVRRLPPLPTGAGTPLHRK